jgi:hypothetical protein
MRRLPCLPLAILLLAAAPAPASADLWSRVFGETLPPEALERELETFETSRDSLRDTIEDAIGVLSEVQDYDLAAAERDAERIREEIEGLLGDLGPSGELGSAARGAHRWMLVQRERVRARPDLSPAQKTLLLPEWDTQIAEVERVIAELEKVEDRLEAQLRIVAGHEGFLEELLLLGKARVATETLTSVLAEFRRIVAEFEALGVDYAAPVN